MNRQGPNGLIARVNALRLAQTAIVRAVERTAARDLPPRVREARAAYLDAKREHWRAVVEMRAHWEADHREELP